MIVIKLTIKFHFVVLCIAISHSIALLWSKAEHYELTSKSFANILSSPYLLGLTRCRGKKKRPSRESRTPKVPTTGLSNTKEKYVHKVFSSNNANN
jgi:hypothetical protein